MVKTKQAVRVETWGKKRFVVARIKGKIQGRQRHTRKISIRKLRLTFKRNGTLNPDIEKIELKTRPYSEFVDTKLSKRPPRALPFMVQASVRIGRDTITASSKTRRWPKVLDAKRQALNRLYQRVSEFVNPEFYDEKKGFAFLLQKNKLSKIEFRLIYYD